MRLVKRERKERRGGQVPQHMDEQNK